MRAKKNRISKRKVTMAKRGGVIFAAGVLAMGLLVGCGASSGGGLFGSKNSGVPDGMVEATAGTRDISTYRSFTGTIQPVNERNVYSDNTGLKITAVSVELGDTVKAGETICTLDTDSISEQIRELEAQMSATERTNALQIQSAQQTYNDYKANLDNNQNSQVLSASQQIDSAFSNLVSAQQAYNTEVTLNNRQLSQTILSAMNSVDSAYEQVRTAELNLDQAKARKSAYGDDSINGYSANQATVDSSSLSVENAWISYNDALKSYEAAKINEESSLTKLFDQYIASQQSYLNALDSYNTAVTQANQQLNSYSTQVQQAQANADSSVNEIKLANLYTQLEDCNVTAPIDGVITILNAKIGDVAANTKQLATVTSFDEMKVQIKINEYDISGVEEGMPIEITIDATNDVYQGSITNISQSATVDNGVAYFTADAAFDGDDHSRGGMSVEAKLTINDEKGVVAIPNAAVQTAADGSAYVLVPSEDGKSTENRAITIGVTDGSYVQIVDGLNEGDTYYSTPSMTDDLSVMMGGGDAGGDRGQGGGPDDGGAPQGAGE